MDRARDWATRIHHEAQCHERNAFLTLTYADEHLPADGSVSVREMQLFIKRLRKALGFRIRFFLCGEYGDLTKRPHYHAIVFGHDFPDKTLWRKTPSGYLTYRSEKLEKIWTYGHAEIGQVTYQSAGYVARYVTKKVNGLAAPRHYERVCPSTGLVVSVLPEFVLMSRRPGIGQTWFDQYSGDCFPSDFVVIEGKKVPIPRAYFKKYEERTAPENHGESVPLVTQSDKIKHERKQRSFAHADNNTPERLAVREELQELKAAKLIRSMEKEL